MIRDRDLDRRRWVEPERDDELDKATWERIDARLTEGPKRPWLIPAGVGVVFAAAALWLVLRPSNAEWNEEELVVTEVLDRPVPEPPPELGEEEPSAEPEESVPPTRAARPNAADLFDAA